MDSTGHSVASYAKPVLYEVHLEPDFKGQTFTGRVLISCEILKPTDHIKLHCKFISIQEAAIEYAGVRTQLDKQATSYDELEETIQLNFGMQVSDGNIKIELGYTGRITNNPEGFYQAHYNANGKEYHLGVTFMKPTYARQVFPCFDEPELKAEFIISAVVDESSVCRSNMPARLSQSLPHSKRFYLFEKTPPMSTYLVALISGPLSVIESQDSRVPISLLCPYGSEDRTTDALDLAKLGLELFEEWFDCGYPLPKLDLVALPDCFFDAMGNWGLIVFKAQRLLLGPGNGERIAESVLREIAHMWFGNLVTMKNWGGTWLKEGLAMLMARMAFDWLHPGGHIWMFYVANELQAELETDSLRCSQPLELIARNASEAKKIFKKILMNTYYEKGLCILRMISKNLGWDKFLAGVNLYISRHQYGSTESDDFWGALEDVSGASIKSKMSIWTRMTGFPVIEVDELLDEATGELEAIKLIQTRFLLSAGNKTDAPQQIYPLNIAIRTEKGVEMFEMNDQELVIPFRGKTWAKVNADHNGFYRTHYPLAHLHKLMKAARDGHLSICDIYGILYDHRALVIAGLWETSALLDVSFGEGPFAEIYECLHLQTIADNFRSIRSPFKFSHPLLRDAIEKVARSVFRYESHALGWFMSAEDNESDIQYKASLFGEAGLAGDAWAIEASRMLFERRISGDKNAIHASLREDVFGIVAKNGAKKELEGLLDIWTKSTNEEERYLALEGLGRASSAELVRWVLSLAFTEKVKDQDIYHLIWHVGSSVEGACELWKWLKSNWDRIEQGFPVYLQCWTLTLAIQGLGTAEHVADVRHHFAGKNTKNYQGVLDRHLELMEIRIQWAERAADNVRAWLSSAEFLQ